MTKLTKLLVVFVIAISVGTSIISTGMFVHATKKSPVKQDTTKTQSTSVKQTETKVISMYLKTGHGYRRLNPDYFDYTSSIDATIDGVSIKKTDSVCFIISGNLKKKMSVALLNGINDFNIKAGSVHYEDHCVYINTSDNQLITIKDIGVNDRSDTVAIITIYTDNVFDETSASTVKTELLSVSKSRLDDILSQLDSAITMK